MVLSVDGYRLAAVLHLPERDHPPFVIGSHGLFSNGSSPKQLELAERLNAEGIAYLRLDHRGCGGSTGEFEAATSLEGRCRDLKAALAWMQSSPRLASRFGFFGSSMGGATCLAAAGRLRPERMVTVAAPIDSRSLLARADHTGRRNVPDVFRGESLQFDLREGLSSLKGLLVFHGELDETVPVAHGRELYARVAEPKKLIVNEGGDHRMSLRSHQLRFLDEAVIWFLPLTRLREEDARK
ncbi:MAG: alpha/beta hydrolase [Desulfobacterales bacterium]